MGTLPGDIIFGKLRPYLAKVHISNKKQCCSGEFCVISINSNDTTFYWLFLISDGFISTVNNSTYGTKMPRASTDYIRNMFVLVPPMKEQLAIKEYLINTINYIDNSIDFTIRSIDEYKKLKQSIISEAVTKGIRKDCPMKDSGIEWIGKIPDNWHIVKIKNIATTSSGGTPNSSDQSLYDGNINWICTYDLEEKPIFSSKRKITDKGANQIAGSLQSKGAVLVSMYGGSSTIGKTGILECEARTNQAICSIQFDKSFVDSYYGFYYIQSIRKIWMYYAEGSRKDPNISQKIVNEMPFIVPSLEEQKEIVLHLKNECEEIDNNIAKKNKIIEELELYKKSIIYEYITGKKEVPEIVLVSEE